MSNDSVHLSIDDLGIATVTIERPPVNALRFADIAVINDTFKRIEEDEAVRVVVLTGAGERAFIAGADVHELAALTPETAISNTDLVQECVDRVYELRQPVICAMNGPAIGSGVAFASASDIRVASTKATFHLPEVNLGVLGGSKHMARIAPPGATRLMMYTGWPMSAQEAYRLGAVDRLVEPGELMNEAMTIAKEIASKLPVAVRMAKDGLNRTEMMKLAEGYAYECGLTAELRRDPESAAQAQSFFERGKV
ncbi:MAG: enoyl-CoA hydratase/isomerase family protein [Solirubrobacteraceae bacterium]